MIGHITVQEGGGEAAGGGEEAAAEESPEAGAAEEEAAAGGGEQGGGEPALVEMENDLVFHPEELTVPVGATVKWVNNGAIVHTTTCDPDAAMDPSHAQLPEGAETWDSGNMAQGDEFTHTFEVAGEYTYFCIPHEATGMIGHITVEE